MPGRTPAARAAAAGRGATRSRAGRCGRSATRSRTSRVVMRKPETTKKTSTPRNPPGSQDGSRWKTRTARMARARNPSRPASRPVRGGWSCRSLPVADLCVAPGRGGHGSAVSLHRAHAATVGAGGDRVTEARSWGRTRRRSPYDRARARDEWSTRRRAADDRVRARPRPGRGVPLVDPRPGARAGPGRATPATPTTAGSRWSPRVTPRPSSAWSTCWREQPSTHRRPGRVESVSAPLWGSPRGVSTFLER